jgi:hypothetical protein
LNAISKQSDTQVSRPILSPQTFDQLVKFSEFAANSDLMPRDYKGKPANVFLAVQMGSELGLAPMQAINSIAVINGRPGVWGDGMIGLCRQSPLCEDIREWIEGEGDERTAFCEAKRRGAASPTTARFSVADAKKAGLWQTEARVKRRGRDGGTYEAENDSPWYRYPDRMLQNRARGFCLRDAFPDLLRGLKSVEELRDTPEDRPEPKPVQSTVVPARPYPERRMDPVAAMKRAEMARAEMDRVLDGDDIPQLEPAPVDKAAVGVQALEAQIRAAATEDELHAIAGSPQVEKQRAWLAKHRPELEEIVAGALGERYQEIVAARLEAEGAAAEAATA